MSEQIVEVVEDLEQPAADGELVHWMDKPPLKVGPGVVSAAAAGGFVLGIGATLAVLALSGWLGPERVVTVPGRRRV